MNFEKIGLCSPLSLDVLTLKRLYVGRRALADEIETYKPNLFRHVGGLLSV